MGVERLDHYTIRTEDLDATRRFYTEILGLSVGARPAFTFPGLWLYQGGNPLVHVVGVEPESVARADDGTGRLDHVAFMLRLSVSNVGKHTKTSEASIWPTNN